MSIERTIIQRLFESKGLTESEFSANGHTYKCVFGKYYQDDQEITREEYFAAKEKSESGDSSNPSGEGTKSNDDYSFLSTSADTVRNFREFGGFEEFDLQSVTDMLGSNADNCYYVYEDMEDSNSFSKMQSIAKQSEILDSKNTESGRFFKMKSPDGKIYVMNNNYGYMSYFVPKN